MRRTSLGSRAHACVLFSTHQLGIFLTAPSHRSSDRSWALRSTSCPSPRFVQQVRELSCDCLSLQLGVVLSFDWVWNVICAVRSLHRFCVECVTSINQLLRDSFTMLFAMGTSPRTHRTMRCPAALPKHVSLDVHSSRLHLRPVVSRACHDKLLASAVSDRSTWVPRITTASSEEMSILRPVSGKPFQDSTCFRCNRCQQQQLVGPSVLSHRDSFYPSTSQLGFISLHHGLGTGILGRRAPTLCRGPCHACSCRLFVRQA